MIQETGADRDDYVDAVLKLYLEMPETPCKAGSHDRQRAKSLHQRRIPLGTIESALLLGSLRRLGRTPESPRLSPVRSLAYFVPVVEELLANPIPDGYLEYLRYKMRKLGAAHEKFKKAGACSEKSGFS